MKDSEGVNHMITETPIIGFVRLSGQRIWHAAENVDWEKTGQHTLCGLRMTSYMHLPIVPPMDPVCATCRYKKATGKGKTWQEMIGE